MSGRKFIVVSGSERILTGRLLWYGAQRWNWWPASVTSLSH